MPSVALATEPDDGDGPVGRPRRNEVGDGEERQFGEFTEQGTDFVRRSVHYDPALLQPDGAGAELLDVVERVRDEEDRRAVLDDFGDAGAALGLERGVADGENLVEYQNLGRGGGRDREGETHRHARGIGADGRVNEVPEFGEIDDVCLVRLQPLLPVAQDGAVEVDVLASGERRVKAVAEGQKRRHLASNGNRSRRRGRDAGDELLQPTSPTASPCSMRNETSSTARKWR